MSRRGGPAANSRSLARSERGASAVEFALLSPLLFLMIFTIIEGSRYIWMKQSLNEAAYSAARCMSVSATCASTSQTRDYAIARARSYQLTVATTAVSSWTNVTCNGNATSNKVTMSVNFDTPLRGFVPGVPTAISSTACFANLS